MADLSNHAGLLPPYALEPERRIASVGYEAEISAAFLPLAKITLPLDAQSDELPFLAWEESVDHWRDEWPEAIKRDVIDAAEQIHIYKGTLYAVEVALKTLKIEADITEWWQSEPEGERGTFDVTAYAEETLYNDGPLLDLRLQEDVVALVTASKPLTRHFTFRVGVHLEAPVQSCGFVAIGAVIAIEGLQAPLIDASAAIAIGGFVLMAATINLEG